MRLGAVVVGVLGALVLAGAAATPARAEDPPWARGVTDGQKADAQKLLDEGNSKFVEHDYVAALASYRAATAVWDHPAIRFNMVRCLIQLDRPLEADDELTRALTYGAAPLEDAVYTEALAYQKLLAQEIGHVAIRCAQPGVEITLDGKPLVTCPGTTDQRVSPGAHQLVGTRVGLAPLTVKLVVVGGQRAEIPLTLVPIAETGVVVHRWATWKPWAVLGAGVGVAGLGALIDYQASRDMASYDAGLARECRDTGCSASTHPIPPDLVALANSARHESELGVSTLTAGAAAIVVGGVLLYLNRDRLVFSAEHLDVAPQPGGAAVTLRGQF